MAVVEHMRIAIACCRRSQEADPSDLYPDPDAAPLQAAFTTLGASSELHSWDDPTVDWSRYDKVLVSSTWDSVDRPGEYLRWARRVSVMTTIVNTLPMLEWNLDKVHQRDLERAGVPVIPTTWIAADESWSGPPVCEFVVKPSISGGGRDTARYRAGDSAALRHVEGLQRRGQTVMVQPYVSGIDSDGETDLVFVGSRFSHAVHKSPLLRVGVGTAERPWEAITWNGRTVPTEQQLDVAQRAVDVISEWFGDVAYARVDLVTGRARTPLVLEAELIDPYLALALEPTSAGVLASLLCG